MVVTSFWGREDHYFLKLWPLFGSHSLLDGPTPLHIQAALTGLSGLPKKKKNEVERGHIRGIRESWRGKLKFVVVSMQLSPINS